MQRKKFIRDFEAGGHLDLFLVTAVAAVLLIRLFLQLTGFPQLGNSTLHVAHMLWGGLGMLVAIVILLSFVGRTGNKLSAVIGGAGFGAFIDEVGKFVTQDNDYFFQPAISIMYVVFILTYIAIRWLHSARRRTTQEYLVNALQETQKVAGGDLDLDERDRALRYLEQCDPNDPLVRGLDRLFRESELVSATSPDVFSRAKSIAVRFYRRIVAKPWFGGAVVLFFVGQLAIQIAHSIALLVFHKSWLEVLIRRPIEKLGTTDTHITYFQLSIALFSLLAAVLVAAGAWQIRKSRLRAYQLFQKSILVSIFFVQPLMFYRDQWSALIGLTFDIVVLVALRFTIEREELTERLTDT
jgi:hypothetical protein